MIDQADIALLAIVAAILLVSVLVTHVTLKRDSWKVQRYKLYKVRDSLIYLVATEKLRETDLVFQRFYKAVNCFINANEHINHGNFVASVQRARKKGIDPAEERNFREISLALRKMGPEVNEVANSFYSTILDILIENSFALRLVMKFGSLSDVIRVLARTIKPVPKEESAFRFYDDYSKAITA